MHISYSEKNPNPKQARNFTESKTGIIRGKINAEQIFFSKVATIINVDCDVTRQNFSDVSIYYDCNILSPKTYTNFKSAFTM